MRSTDACAWRPNQNGRGFLQEVRVRKRTWNKDDLSTRVEKVHYLCPSVENHGHRVVKDGERPRLTRYVLAPTTEPEDETVWIAVV